ncbi:hypothetical protein [Foetidibacter luteolus]|uniref:hypothetical protein n=1 Tax=Foetidibacter luteolus TaxID=2608880 RepID=UPI00129B3021|nr:hypothetical protein [Foetidibacter luteolus]
MRQLTERALNYLHGLKRNKDAVTNRNELESFFLNQNIPVFEPVINYGVSFSGFTFRTKLRKGDAFSTFLVLLQDIESGKPFEFEKEQGKFLFYCGDHETAQFWFYIDQDGQFCSDGYSGANVLSSSFEVKVEQYAFKNCLLGWIEHPYYYELKDLDSLLLALTNHFDVINECTDGYNSWFRSDNLIVQIGIWLHEQSYFVHFYGKSGEALAKFIADLEGEKII